MSSNRICISYWLPRLEGAGVPVPRTTIIKTDVHLSEMFDNGSPEGLAAFHAQLRAAADKYGYPIFLRTGQGSGKHDWKRTCFVESSESIPQHVFNLCEWSELVDMMGLPFDVWAVREFLKLDVAMTLPAYEGMPLAREFRFFVSDGEIHCWHPYWPEFAVERGHPTDPDWKSKVAELSSLVGTEKDTVFELARRVAVEFEKDGAWSVDICKTADGRWLVTDMAVAERSWHWPGCIASAESPKEKA